jgi:hypothetical protein
VSAAGRIVVLYGRFRVSVLSWPKLLTIASEGVKAGCRRNKGSFVALVIFVAL